MSTRDLLLCVYVAVQSLEIWKFRNVVWQTRTISLLYSINELIVLCSCRYSQRSRCCKLVIVRMNCSIRQLQLL